MDKQFFKEVVGWGVGLWFIGYVLGVVLFFVVPATMIGWVISPIGILITLWVLIKKINGQDVIHYLKIAVAWTVIAVVFDYLFLVLLFKPADGYYKFDVYFYYFTTFALPLIVGIFKNARRPLATTIGGIVGEEMKNKNANIEKILKFMEEKALVADMDELRIVNNDVEKLLGVSNDTAERYLHELVQEGILKQMGIVERGVYYVKI